MKIVNYPLYSPTQQRPVGQDKIHKQTGFDQVLAQALQKNQGNQDVQQTQAAQAAEDVAAVQPVDEEGPSRVPVTQAQKQLLNEVENLLGHWEEYAQQLENSASLKDVYASLERVAQAVDKLRQAAPNAAAGQAALEDVVGELDVLAVTELFKFNRGDYQASGPNDSSTE